MTVSHHKVRCGTKGCAGTLGFFWRARRTVRPLTRGEAARPGNDAVTCPHCGVRWELAPACATLEATGS